MSQDHVVTRLFALDRVLCLARATGAASEGAPAVLTIPRGGSVREPRLLVFGDRDASRPGIPLFTDAHVVARYDHDADEGRLEVADVLIGPDLRAPFRPERRLRRTLQRYPGCGVAVRRWYRGLLAAARDGSVVATRGSCGADAVWAPICGSFLYSWAAAGLSLAELPRMLLVVGRITAADAGRPGTLETMGRVQVTGVRPAPARWRLAS
ncbi:hypothetical protein [Actinomadura keratinilytica]|jgi:hypothetical protein|uniref:Uncharacterized protein n=1 Tax=Actinomadura keratinilytica TaxID=547461 RepID=A0ABP7YHG0_9ACTN